MKNRSPAAVLILSLVTFGIYAVYWEVKTKGELTGQGADIPTSWLIIVPIANLYWTYKYAVGVEQVSKGKVSAVLTLILLLLLSVVGMAILQSEFNKLGAAPAAGPVPPAPPIDPVPPADAVPPSAPEAPSAPPTV